MTRQLQLLYESSVTGVKLYRYRDSLVRYYRCDNGQVQTEVVSIGFMATMVGDLEAAVALIDQRSGDV